MNCFIVAVLFITLRKAFDMAESKDRRFIKGLIMLGIRFNTTDQNLDELLDTMFEGDNDNLVENLTTLGFTLDEIYTIGLLHKCEHLC